MMWFSGFRGAMAFALAIKTKFLVTENEVGNIILTITVCFALMNIYFHATLLEKTIKYLKIPTNKILKQEAK